MQQAQEAMSRVRVSASYGSVHVAEAILSEANSVQSPATSQLVEQYISGFCC